MKISTAIISVLLATAACGSDENTSESTTSQTLISDGNNSGGTPGFYFLGAYGNPPASFPGTFDGGFKTQLSYEFLPLANCTNTNNTTGSVIGPFGGVLVYPTAASPYYYFSRNVGTIPLPTNNCYRMQIKLSGAVLGFRDLHVTTGLAATGYIRVPPTSNLQVAMRLETSLRTDTDADTVPNFRDNCPTVANTNQADLNSNGIGDACEIVDADGDTIPDGSDNCPAVANLGQENADSDSAGDACEDCDTDANKLVPGQCGCGISETDSDLDGTPDCNDQCPNDFNKLSPGQCGCGVLDTDSDLDGRANCNETCNPNPQPI